MRLRRAEGREFDPRPGQYSRMSFSSDQVTGTVFPHLNSFQIYLEHCPRGEALIIGHLRHSFNEVASHVKQLPFRPLLLSLYLFSFIVRCASIVGVMNIDDGRGIGHIDILPEKVVE